MFDQTKSVFFSVAITMASLLLMGSSAYGEDICKKECNCFEFSATKLGVIIPLLPPGVVICGAWPASNGKEFVYRVRPPEAHAAPYYYLGSEPTRDYYIVATPEGIIRYGGNHLQELVNGVAFDGDFKRVLVYSVIRENVFDIPGNDVSGDTEPFTVIDGIQYKKKDLPKIDSCPDDKNRSAQKIGNRYIVNGHKGKIYDEASDFVFSDDCEGFAYLAKKNSELFVVFNGKEQKHYRCLFIQEGEGAWDTAEINNLVISPDSKKLAYSVTIEPPRSGSPNSARIKKLVVNNNETTITFNTDKMGGEVVGKIFFSDDSNRVAYTLHDYDVAPSGAGLLSWWVVVDGEKGKGYKKIDAFVFSHDSKSFAYIANDGEKEFVVINGKELDKYDDVAEIKFFDQKIIYSAKNGNVWSLAVRDINTGVSSFTKEKVPFAFSIVRGGHETSYRLELENSHILVYMNGIKL